MNLPRFTKPFLFRFSGYALLLNGIWEFAQCPLLYDMGGFSAAKSICWIAAAIIGDVVLALVVIYVAALITSGNSIVTARFWMATLAIGPVVGAGAEWIARAEGLWEYSAHMPVVRLWNLTVGLVPVLQMAVLPALSLHLARQSTRTHVMRPESNPSPPKADKLEAGR